MIGLWPNARVVSDLRCKTKSINDVSDFFSSPMFSNLVCEETFVYRGELSVDLLTVSDRALINLGTHLYLHY